MGNCKARMFAIAINIRVPYRKEIGIGFLNCVLKWIFFAAVFFDCVGTNNSWIDCAV